MSLTCAQNTRLRKAIDGLDVVYGRRRPGLRDAPIDPGLELAKAVVEYFGAGPIDPLLTSDRALRECARVIVANAGERA